jgi:hypothetical protein
MIKGEEDITKRNKKMNEETKKRKWRKGDRLRNKGRE